MRKSALILLALDVDYGVKVRKVDTRGQPHLPENEPPDCECVEPTRFRQSSFRAESLCQSDFDCRLYHER
jgi:hypothetical protein